MNNNQCYSRVSLDDDLYEEIWTELDTFGYLIDGDTTFSEFSDIYQLGDKYYECIWYACNIGQWPHHINVCTPIEHPQLELFPK